MSVRNSAFRNGKDIPQAKPQETQAGSRKDAELSEHVRDATQGKTVNQPWKSVPRGQLS